MSYNDGDEQELKYDGDSDGFEDEQDEQKQTPGRTSPRVDTSNDRLNTAPLRNRPAGYSTQEQLRNLQNSLNTSRKAVDKQGQQLGLQDTHSFRELNSLSGELRFGADPNDVSVPLSQVQEDLNTITRAQRRVAQKVERLKDQHLGQPEENDTQGIVPLRTLLDRMPLVGQDTSERGYTDRSYMLSESNERMKLQVERMKDLLDQRDRELSRPVEAQLAGPVPTPITPLGKQLWYLMTAQERCVVHRFEKQMIFTTQEFNLLGVGLVGTRMSNRRWNDSRAVSILVHCLYRVFTAIRDIYQTVVGETENDIDRFVQPMANLDEWVALLNTQGGTYSEGHHVLVHVMKPCFRQKGLSLLYGVMSLLFNPKNPIAIRGKGLNELLHTDSHAQQIKNYLMSFLANDEANSGKVYVPVSIRQDNQRRMNAATLYFRHYGQSSKSPQNVNINFF